MEEKIINKIKDLGDHNKSDVRGICLILNELIYLHVEAEINHPEYLHYFRELFPHALSLLNHPNAFVRRETVNFIGTMKLNASIVVPKLLEMLEESRHERQGDEKGAVIRAIIAYKDDAEMAVPVLLEYLNASNSSCDIYHYAHAITSIGVVSNDIIRALEKARDRTTFSIKSDDKSFKGNINRFIRELKRSSNPSAKSTYSNDRQSYLFDLLDRLQKNDDGIGSSLTTTAYKARQESLKLTDEGLIVEIQNILRKKISISRHVDLLDIVGHITANTKSDLGRDIIMQTLGQKKISDRILQATIYAASKAKLREAFPEVSRLLRSGDSTALRFVDAMPDEIFIPDIICFMDKNRDCRLLAIFSLEHIGSSAAIPPLVEFASRDLASRKADEWEWRYYSIIALGKIGDKSVAPTLMELLKRYKGWDSPILQALCALSDPRAYNSVVESLDRIVAKGLSRNARDNWSQGHRTDIVNGIEFFKKTNLHLRPEVERLISRIAEFDIWDRLFPEERQYLCSLEVGFEEVRKKH